MTHRKPKVRDIVQFSLPNGQFAYGRILRNGSVAFYAETSSHPFQPPIGNREYQFVVGVTSSVLTDDAVPIVGHESEAWGDDDWPPDGSIQDSITGEMSLYHRGTIEPSTPEATAALEPVAAWDLHHLVDRLMGFGHLWTTSAYDIAQEVIARRELSDPD